MIEKRSVLALVVSGVTTSAWASWYCRDVAFQSFVAGPAGSFLAVITAVFVAAALAVGTRPQRRTPLFVAVASVVVVNLVVLAIAVSSGWLSGIAFRQPLRYAALVYAPAIAWYLAVPLMIYGRLAASAKPWAVAAYAGFVLGFSAVSVVVVRRLLSDGTFVFAGGYSLAWDSLWGAAQYVLALLVYRRLNKKLLVARPLAF